MISVSGKRPGVRAVQEPGDVGLAGAREVVVLLHRPHLRAREALERRCGRRNPSPACPTI